MNFDWCRRERGFDFAFVTRVFEGRTVEQVDARRDYGEDRVKAIGVVDGVIYSVVYTDRGDVRTIIAAWPAHDKERALWRLSE